MTNCRMFIANTLVTYTNVQSASLNDLLIIMYTLMKNIDLQGTNVNNFGLFIKFTKMWLTLFHQLLHKDIPKIVRTYLKTTKTRSKSLLPILSEFMNSITLIARQSLSPYHTSQSMNGRSRFYVVKLSWGTHITVMNAKEILDAEPKITEKNPKSPTCSSYCVTAQNRLVKSAKPVKLFPGWMVK